MCGRYALAVSEEDLVEVFDLPGLTFEHHPRYNIAPGQLAPVVAEDDRGRRMGLLEWGFLPAWKDEPTGAFINARAESVARKRSFREAFARRRCLVPANGFYEWKARDGRKIPHWIHPAAGGLVSFAGIWESWQRPGAEPRHTFAILTTDANAEVAPIHDRMPVVVAPGDRDRWLDRSTPTGRLGDLLVPAADGSFEVREVSPRVNRPDDDDAGLIEPR
ncbi:MAG: SOS response-associated peptidase [Gemmatimonadota bacterium]|nr:SOS response-associated peptidase [Gemmatimonadota bacterium]